MVFSKKNTGSSVVYVHFSDSNRRLLTETGAYDSEALREAMIDDARTLSEQAKSRKLQEDDITEQIGTAMGAIFLDCTFQVSFSTLEFKDLWKTKDLIC